MRYFRQPEILHFIVTLLVGKLSDAVGLLHQVLLGRLLISRIDIGTEVHRIEVLHLALHTQLTVIQLA